jgi:hypothetical protein
LGLPHLPEVPVILKTAARLSLEQRSS